MAKEKVYKPKDMAGIAFVGFFFIGMAAGAFFDRWDVGPFAGLGMGFIAMLLVMMKYKNES